MDGPFLKLIGNLIVLSKDNEELIVVSEHQ